MPRKLKPIGEGSRAHEHGYTYKFLLGWLENIRDNELEKKAESKPSYSKRADALSDALDVLLNLE